MFNKTVNVQGQKEYVPYVKEVKEIKAPTDKSVELLNEMQEKARKNIIDTVSIRNNIFNATFFISQSPHDYQKVITYKFILNGQEYFGEIKHDFDFSLTRYRAIEEVKKKIADALHTKVIEFFARHVVSNLDNKIY